MTSSQSFLPRKDWLGGLYASEANVRYGSKADIQAKAQRSPLIPLVQPPEFLDALPRVHFRGVEVALPVDGDVVERGELARLPPRAAEAGEDVLRCALDDAHLAVHPVGHVDEPLLAVGREHQ